MHGRSISVAAHSSLSPNPVYGTSLQFSLMVNENSSYTWMLLDAFGYVRSTQKVGSDQRQNVVTVDVSNLETGVYTILTDKFGSVGRFVRM
ncbi:MAG: T9SS type A sorting domain-containing protein [Saprospiraceae bacterium]